MGLSSFPSAAEGVLPVLVMNTLMSVAILKSLLRSVLQLMGASVWISTHFEDDSSSSPSSSNELCKPNSPSRRGITITKFKALCEQDGVFSKFSLGEIRKVKCCVCLSKFREEQEVSVLACKHFFHKGCLDECLANHHNTCPLCRSSC